MFLSKGRLFHIQHHVARFNLATIYVGVNKKLHSHSHPAILCKEGLLFERFLQSDLPILEKVSAVSIV